jgi:hypothetical protein
MNPIDHLWSKIILKRISKCEINKDGVFSQLKSFIVDRIEGDPKPSSSKADENEQ